MKWIAGGVATLVLAAGLAVGLTRGGQTSPLSAGPSLTGAAPAPAISGKDLVTGRRISLAGYRGRPVFINAWASWCGPCRDEAPEIRRFTADHPEIVMLGINMNEPRSNGLAFNADAGWTHPSIIDTNGDLGFDRLKIRNLPATIYVDAKGIERGRTPGPVTYDELVGVAARI